MKKFIAMLWIVVALFFATNIFGAESVTQTMPFRSDEMRVIKMAVVTKSDGAITTTAINSTYFPEIRGWHLCFVQTDPAASTPAPTNAYDLTIVDANNYDVTGGAIANRSNANTETVMPLLYTSTPGCYPVWTTSLSLTCAAAGDTKQFDVYMVFQKNPMGLR